MSAYSFVIFDLDGTLLDTLDDLTSAVNHALAAHGYPLHPREAVRGFVGNGVDMLVRRALPEGTEDDARARVLSTMLSYYHVHRQDQTRPYDGILDMLSGLRQKGVGIAVVSNKNDDNVKALCRDCFQIDLAIGERPGMPCKPDPAGVRLALEQLGATTENTLYVGDSLVDLETAKNAGLHCLAVTWGFCEEARLKDAGAVLLARHPQDILRLL